MGRIHRNLMVANIAKYAWGYDAVPYTLTQSETWDFPIKFYQDIIIPAGVTLTVQCELHMVPQARIMVQPGGRLVVNGGRVQAALFAPERWQGITVLGNPLLPQTNANQGVVELLNGAVIADAITGITVGPGASSGGIVRSMGGALENSFVNCARAVRFFPYLFATGPGTFAANASFFMRTRFVVNPDFMEYTGATPFTEHVRLNRVVGLRFRNCTFINTREATTSAELGHGIRAQDAQFFLYGNSIVEGLDHGIHSTGLQPYGWFEAGQSVFKNNICGIYTSQPDACRIVGNRFVMGLRDVQMTGSVDAQMFPFHRGIFMHESSKFNIRFNVLQRDDDLLAANRPLEGIVVGYNRDFNDVVRSNRAVDLDRGFVGEGVNCSTIGFASTVGLQYKCDACDNTLINIWSRPDGSVPLANQGNHSMRAYQGDLLSPADNTLDNWPFGDPLTDDFRVTTTFSAIRYIHRPGAPFAPTDWSLPNWAFPWQTNTAPAYACPTIPEPPTALAPQDPEVSAAELEAAKLAYGNVRYQYEQLIDGGSTDEVVEEITDAWPQNYLELRDYLLAYSPYLSVDALKEAMNKPGFPDAIRAEICIANPDATRSAGFMEWLLRDCLYPLPGYLIANIVASWDASTYRTVLDEQMAGHHERYSQAAVEWMDHYLTDTTQFSLESLRMVWQEVRTPAARYAEATILLEQGEYAAASTMIAALEIDPQRYPAEYEEQQRMLAWITFYEVLRQSGRTEAELTAGEITQLQSLIGEAQDRPAVWIGQMLCFHYDLCSPIHTGGEEEEPKSLRLAPPVIATPLRAASLSVVPNPATTWMSFSFETNSTQEAGSISVQDILGKEVHAARVSGTEGQVIWDCRNAPVGTYTVSLFSSSGAQLAVQRAIVKP